MRVTGTHGGKTQYCKVRAQQLLSCSQYARKLHCRSVEICCLTTAKRQLMLMLPRVDQVDNSNM
eukprot:COSAG06_NODE_44292_length_364_cov_1.475472_1_plen_63_part_10